MKIPGLIDFILSSLPQQSNRSQTLADYQGGFEIEWLFPQELEVIRHSDPGRHDWAEGIRLLKSKADSIRADISSELQKGDVGIPSVPPGLLNRWRIWKMLELIAEE